ncbi:MAG: hypothetical protein WC804_11945 [Sphingomonas sp.]|uniref:hypothetical protein n=1 Tax=Sphingomonas sp. TaxID=28214 RepID=UPI0035621D93
MSALTLWTMDKTVALGGERRHLHKGALVAPAFSAPPLAPQIQFSPTALAAAMARTATLRNAPLELLMHIRDSALSEARILLAEGAGFELSPLLADLADSERTHFASRIGAGITDLYMNALGYAWRDNAACLSSALKPHADFLYYGGNALGHGVVLAEARGSFATKVSAAGMAAAAERKYLRQVRPYIGASSPHGRVIHGYSIAFGSQPGTTGAFLRLSQTLRGKPKAKPGTPKSPTSLAIAGTPAGFVPTGMALASHRSNFALMDAIPVARWIDWLGGKSEAPVDKGPITFLRFNYAGRPFLAPAQALMPFKSPYLWFEALHGHPFWREQWEQYVAGPCAPFFAFAMEESAAVAFLETLTGLIRSEMRRLPEALDLPTGELAGIVRSDSRDGHFTSTRDELARGDYDYALFRDGLALIAGPPPRKLTGVRSWHPKEGLD